MLQTLTLALIFAVGPPPAEAPAAILARLHREAYSGVVTEASAPPFVAHARKYPDDPSAVRALLTAASFTRPTSELHKQVTARLEKHYARSPLVGQLLSDRGYRPAPSDDSSFAFLRQVGDANPDKRTRGLAWRTIVNGRLGAIRATERGLVRMRPGKSVWQDHAIRDFHANIVRWTKEVADARAKLSSPELAAALPDISVGAKAPPTEAVDLDGKKVSLADHRGKVVVLDFWSTGCAPCLKMVPRKNALIEELKGKPFVLIGVNGNADREEAREFLTKTKMPWVHWWSARQSKAFETWDVEGFPVLYVIDHEGVIRYHQAGYAGDNSKLYDVVRALVKKAEAARAAK